MTSIDVPNQKIRGVRKASKLSTKIDMTPMVDLGFLLITFFIFSATMTSPTTMDLSMPKESGDATPIKQSAALTIILINDGVLYYEGLLQADASNLNRTNFKNIRDVIIEKKKEVIAEHKHDPYCEEITRKSRLKGDPEWEFTDLDRDFVVVIKPSPDATYKNAIDILDEMTINNVKRFAMVRISEPELQIAKQRKG